MVSAHLNTLDSLFSHWRIMALQCCVSFCYTRKWISYVCIHTHTHTHTHTHIHIYIYPPPSWSSFPTPLPHHTPLGHRITSSWAPCAIQQLPTSYLFYTWQCLYVILSWGFLGSPRCWLTMEEVSSVQSGLPAMSYLYPGAPHWISQFVKYASQSQALLSSPASQSPSLKSQLSIMVWRLCLPNPASSVLPSMSIHPPSKLLCTVNTVSATAFWKTQTGTQNSEWISKRSRRQRKIVLLQDIFSYTHKSAAVEQCNLSSLKQIVLNMPNGSS